jgi:DNA-binding CsgD family transcriptional regulator
MEQLQEELTAREIEVLSHLANGLTTKEIAAEMYLGYETVREYQTGLRRKLGARSQLQIVLAAARLGLLPDDHPLGRDVVAGAPTDGADGTDPQI